jgi:hypothetical protein
MDVCLIQGDVWEGHYTFYDVDGYLLTDETVETALFSVDRLKYKQELVYSEETGEWLLVFPSDITKKFKPFIGCYNITLIFYDGNSMTPVCKNYMRVIKK